MKKHAEKTEHCPNCYGLGGAGLRECNLCNGVGKVTTQSLARYEKKARKIDLKFYKSIQKKNSFVSGAKQ